MRLYSKYKEFVYFREVGFSDQKGTVCWEENIERSVFIPRKGNPHLFHSQEKPLRPTDQGDTPGKQNMKKVGLSMEEIGTLA